jgi:hypothetical protein
LGEKLILAASVLDGQRNLGGSVLASFLRDRTDAQCGKRHCHSRCHFRFDGQPHTDGSLTRPMLDSQGMCLEEIFSSLHPPPKLNEAMLCASNGS